MQDIDISALQKSNPRGQSPQRMPAHSVQPQTGWTMASIATDGAARWPNEVAVCDGVARLTFRELHAAARILAERLLELGVKPGDRIAVAGECNADTVVAILGVCLSGACYVALDPSHPPARLAFLLEDAGARGVIATADVRKIAESKPEIAFCMAVEGLTCARRVCNKASKPRALPTIAPDSVAYVMYTSGSTGMPKGVQIEHRQVRAFFEAHNERVGLGPGDRCLSNGPFHFDVSLMDVFLPLYAGASVFFTGSLPIPTVILRALEHHRITHFYAVGTLLGLITGDGKRLDNYDLSALRVLQTGAEVCNVRVVNEWLKRYPNLGFLNSYGPTEATVGCISYVKPSVGPLREGECPIGRPHSRTRCQLLDADNKPVSRPDVIGELVLAGQQLMRGYWRRSLENQKAFVWLNNERYYRTGDYAYLDQNGDYHFVSRLDDEIKLNGYRIHLNEICRCLESDSCVEAALAGTISPRGDTSELVVLLVSEKIATLELAHALEQLLRSRLPSYMQPARWAFMHAFPRLSSGKADRDGILRRLAGAVRTNDARFYIQNGDDFSALVK
jgi:amino acid adenylation domain-containing protein